MTLFVDGGSKRAGREEIESFVERLEVDCEFLVFGRWRKIAVLVSVLPRRYSTAGCGSRIVIGGNSLRGERGHAEIVQQAYVYSTQSVSDRGSGMGLKEINN